MSTPKSVVAGAYRILSVRRFPGGQKQRNKTTGKEFTTKEKGRVTARRGDQVIIVGIPAELATLGLYCYEVLVPEGATGVEQTAPEDSGLSAAIALDLSVVGWQKQANPPPCFDPKALVPLTKVSSANDEPDVDPGAAPAEQPF